MPNRTREALERKVEVLRVENAKLTKALEDILLECQMHPDFDEDVWCRAGAEAETKNGRLVHLYASTAGKALGVWPVVGEIDRSDEPREDR